LYNEAAAVQVRGVPPLQADARDLERVVSDCIKAVELEPGDAIAFLLRAKAYRAKGDLSRALADYESGRQLKCVQCECSKRKQIIHRETW
jgi:Tfp pilus assembly protein PilF